MSLPLPFTEDQRDALQEIINVAMGAAGESLAAFAEVFVQLPIPVIRYLEPNDLKSALSAVDEGEKISVVAQRFTTDANEGFALVAITESSFRDLSEFTGREVTSDAVASELLTDLAATIASTCLNRLSEMAEVPMTPAEAPEVVTLHSPLHEFSFADILGWDSVVSAEINYHLENHPFNCDLLLLFPESGIEDMKMRLDALLA
jgi:chemotaxis protein CheY-P-specific phosphatase CheC